MMSAIARGTLVRAAHVIRVLAGRPIKVPEVLPTMAQEARVTRVPAVLRIAGQVVLDIPVPADLCTTARVDLLTKALAVLHTMAQAVHAMRVQAVAARVQESARSGSAGVGLERGRSGCHAGVS
jgi:hypothetical protein